MKCDERSIREVELYYLTVQNNSYNEVRVEEKKEDNSSKTKYKGNSK